MSISTRLNPNNRRNKHRRFRPDWPHIAVLVAAVFLGVVVLATASTVYFLSRIHTPAEQLNGEPFPKPKGSDRVNVLVMGLDAEIGPDGKVVQTGFKNRRSDVMMLFSGDPVTNKVSMISIPRDSLVKIPGRGEDKINAAHAHGGAALAMETVQDFLGVPVHYYVRANFEGLAKLVDALGGIEYTVEKRMYYADPYQSLVIDLKPGKQVLDGARAVAYCRYRADGDDITRIGRQQKFIRAVIEKALSLTNLWRMPKIAMDLTQYIETDIGTGDIMRYADMAVSAARVDLETATIPGTGQYIDGISYWVPDQAGVRALVNKMIRGVDTTANAKIKIEVLNGSGASGAGTRFADQLRRDGFNIVRVATADRTDYKQTMVVDHRGISDNVDRLGNSLKGVIANPRFRKQVSQSSQADLTIIVGSDYSATAGH